MGRTMITGQELYELLQARAYGFLWAGWDLINPEVKKAFENVAAILNEREDARHGTEGARA